MAKSSASSSASDETIAVAGCIGLAVVLVAIGWVSLHLAAALTGGPAPATNPIRLAADVAAQRTQWGAAASVVCGGLLAVAAALVWAIMHAWGRGTARGTREFDRAARHMATPTQTKHLTQKQALEKSRRLGLDPAPGTLPGVPWGTQIPGGKQMLSSWEDMGILIAGPRTFKTTAFAIPQVLAAPGPVVATSNKPDLLAATRGLREGFGRLWILDPQAIAQEPPTWWWNPLTYIAPFDPATGGPHRDPATGHTAADFAAARKMAEQFELSTRPENAGSTDDYFGPEGVDLIAQLLLAAAVGGKPITIVFDWLTNPEDPEPVDLLRDHGFPILERGLYATSHLTPKQRDGIYGTARGRLGFLRDPKMTQWVTPPASPVARLNQFHPAAYASTQDTLYLLSKKGASGAAPVVAALTMAVFDALEAHASTQGGRLRTPFLAVLDEAANICRVRDLDSYYSYFGSQGIVIVTILQSWAQGEEVWGERGMEKLWDSANMRVAGGNVDDPKYLRRLVDLLGHFEKQTVSRSSGRGGTSRSVQAQEKPILTVAQLRRLKDRAIAFPSSTPPVLLKPRRWFESADKARINAAIAATERVEVHQ